MKSRKRILTPQIRVRLNEVLTQVADQMDFVVLEANGEEDHIHLLIEYPPKHSISKIVNHLKGVDPRILRKEFNLAPHQEHLWSPSYFAISCGGAPLEKIKAYIEN